jgi:hypothetical protein
MPHRWDRPSLNQQTAAMSPEDHDGAPAEDIPRHVRSALLEYEENSGEDTEEYKYTPLPSDKKRIRLLRLYPGTLKSPQVMCEMFEAEFVERETLPRIVVGHDSDACLTEPIAYEALSWRWGDEDNSHYTIMIRREDGKMYKKRVSETLGLALKYMRLRNDRILWIDAISIDQKNKEERSYQVSMMALVYTRAEQVCVWLGDDDENSRKAFKFIRNEISHLKDFDQLCKDPKNAEKWRAFLGLMQRDWFSRRWCVQEIALATTARVYCGPDELEWREIAIAVELFVEVETVTHRLSELLKNDAKSNIAPNWFEHISELGASLLVNATARIFREYQRADQIPKSPVRRSLLSLEYLVTSLSIFGCGRPHDSVYALIAIARDASPNPPTSVKEKRKQTLIAQVFGDQLEQKPYLLDYNSPYPEVCREFVQFCIERCAKRDPLQALDVLCRPWAKDWQPGDYNVDEDKPRLKYKEGIIKKRKENGWMIHRSEDSEPFLLDGSHLFQRVITPSITGRLPTPVSRHEQQEPSGQISAGVGRFANGESAAGVPTGSTSDNDDTTAGAERNTIDPANGQGTSHPGRSELLARTHLDKRKTDQYWDQVGFKEKNNVEDFILLAFPKESNESDPSTPSSTPSKRRRLVPGKDEWKTVRDAMDNLGDDPEFKDILQVKAELAAADQARADRAKADRNHYKVPTSQIDKAKFKRPNHPRIKELELPSWVANIDGAPFDIFPHAGMDMVKMGRRNADPLVGTPLDGHRNYSAGQTKVVDLETLKFKRRAQLGHYSLYLKGFCFDRVDKVSQVSQAGAIPASWLDLAGWTEARKPTGINGKLDDPPTAFWRTLVADRGRNDRNPPYYYARACRETILKGGIRSNAVDTTALIYHERNSIIAEYCRRVQSVIWNRALIKTKKGNLGLVSEEVREGDLICILYGCTVPVILRRVTPKFKTKNELNNERLEDGVEAMKRIVLQMERYRERKLQYDTLDDAARKEVQDHTADYNKKHAVRKDLEKIAKDQKELEDLEEARQRELGEQDTQSDIDDEDELPELEQEEETDTRQDRQSRKRQRTAEPQMMHDNRDDAARKEKEKEEEDETIQRHKLRQRKAKIRDPLRYYRFLDQAYIHGMMDGEAVRQKFYMGKPDHMFEIR